MLTLYKNYPYDNTYSHIKTFTSASNQTSWFNSLTKKTISDTDYIKDHESFIIEENYDTLLMEGYNYISFKNDQKTIYAFVVRKEWESYSSTKIYYEIDVIQTFMFDFSIKDCFIERMHCALDKVSDFEDGLECGEYNIADSDIMLYKTPKFFAVFNGIKQQQLEFDSNGYVKNVYTLPFNSEKPMTLIDTIQYPVYFMPLQDSYKAIISTPYAKPGGETFGGTISAKILRFIKGYEGFAEYPNYFNGESFRTYGYGVTELYQSKYFELLGDAPVNEQKASEILAQMMNNEFAWNLYYRMLEDGCTAQTIRQQHFDAFLSLAMNGGMVAVTTSPMYAKYLVNPDDSTIYDEWLDWYVYGSSIEDGPLPGLIARRQEEARIYRDGVYNYRSIGVYGSMGTLVGTVTDNNGHGYIPSTVNGEV